MKNSEVTYLVGDGNISVAPFAPYTEAACQFLHALAQELRSTKENYAYKDIIAFAFWCRKANVTKLKKEFEEIRLGRGLVFHITPSNVPVNFAFSFVFSLLAGNANIVRVPSRPYPQVDIICKAINKVLMDSKFDAIKQQTAFIKYEKNDVITAHFSNLCQARIIWGGDFAIQSIRNFPVSERAVEVVFADRYSFCVLSAETILNLDDAGLKRLADGFYNDTYLMDQNACSSPHLVIWQGENTGEAKERFWQAVFRSAQKYELKAVNAVDKYLELCHQVIEQESICKVRKYGNLIYCLELAELPAQTDTLRGRFGFFYEYETVDLSRIARIVNPKYQTLTYFGVAKQELLNLVVNNHLLGVDRIVPIGSALDIGIIWDGYNIVEFLSRVIELK